MTPRPSRARQDEIIAAMADTAKPYFGDVAEMTYEQLAAPLPRAGRRDRLGQTFDCGTDWTEPYADATSRLARHHLARPLRGDAAAAPRPGCTRDDSRPDPDPVRPTS